MNPHRRRAPEQSASRTTTVTRLATAVLLVTMIAGVTPGAAALASNDVETATTTGTTSGPSASPVAVDAHVELRRLRIPNLSGTAEFRRSSCAARELALGTEPRYASLRRSEIDALAGVTGLRAPSGSVEGVNVSVVCQMAYFVRDGEVARVFRVSTGKPGLRTIPGTYRVGWKVDGWRESRAYPGSMMYRPMFFNGGQAIHGMASESMVKSTPASHGCVRTPRADVDWIWSHWQARDRVRVYGTWR